MYIILCQVEWATLTRYRYRLSNYLLSWFENLQMPNGLARTCTQRSWALCHCTSDVNELVTYSNRFNNNTNNLRLKLFSSLADTIELDQDLLEATVVPWQSKIIIQWQWPYYCINLLCLYDFSNKSRVVVCSRFC